MLAIGVDIGGTKIGIGVVDEEGNILEKARLSTDASDAAGIDQAIADECNLLAKKFPIGAIGVAAAGFVSPDRKTVLFAPNVAWRDYPLAQNLKELIDIDVPIVVENDANAAGWAEYRFGAGKGSTDMLMLTIGTGLGGALIVNGELVRGKYGVASELGHMRVVPGGHYCGCGHAGCWEMYASGTALVRAAQHAVVANPVEGAPLLQGAGGDPYAITGPQITKAAKDGDQLAINLLADLGNWIGEGAASVAAVLDPEIVVVGGGVAAAGDLLLTPIRNGYTNALSALGHRPVARIELAQAGNDAGIIGAADLARR